MEAAVGMGLSYSTGGQEASGEKREKFRDKGVFWGLAGLCGDLGFSLMGVGGHLDSCVKHRV